MVGSLTLIMCAAGYVSRAAFKLLEIQKKHKIIKQGTVRLALYSSVAAGACARVRSCARTGFASYSGHLHGTHAVPCCLLALLLSAQARVGTV